MKNTFLLLILLQCSIQTQGQIEPWKIEGNVWPIGLTFYQPIGTLGEKEQSITISTQSLLLKYSHYGEPYNSFLLENSDIPSPSGNFYLDEITDADTSYYLTANWSNANGNIYLSTYFKTGELATSYFELSDVISVDTSSGPAGIKTAEEDYLFFGQEYVQKVSVESAYSINFMWRKPIYGGLVSSVKETCAGYLTCSLDGVINHYDFDLDLFWAVDLPFAAKDIVVVPDGFLIAGNKGSKGQLFKLDLAGNILWQKEYEEIFIHSICATSSGDLLIGGADVLGEAATLDYDYRLMKLDKNGTSIWNRFGVGAPIIRVLESLYGNLIILAKIDSHFYLLVLNENGNFEEATYQNYYRPSLDINNISTRSGYRGLLFSHSDINRGYFFPKDNFTSTIKNAMFWVAGLPETGAFRASVNWNSTALKSFHGGPYGIGQRFSSYAQFWNRTFTINKKMIVQFLNDFNDGGIDLPIPLDMIRWPAIGNPNIEFKGEKIEINKATAPFVDVNGDNIYNIYDGDYPKIKGDEMIWWVMHDSFPSSVLSHVGLEVYGSLYAYSCDDKILNNATFLDLKVINKSDRLYTDLKCGLFTDFQIGCNEDDYIGYMPHRNTYYAYNATETDLSPCLNTSNSSFENTPPIQSITFLNQSISNGLFYNNGDWSLPYSDLPNEAADIYKFMNSVWPDGTALRQGKNGFSNTDSIPASIPFTGNPAVASEWSMCQENLVPEDFHFMANSSHSQVAPGQSIDLHYGLLTHTGINDLPCPDITQIEPELEALQNLYDNYLSTDTAPYFLLNLGPDRRLDEYESISLDAGEGAESYLWSTGETTQRITIDQPGTYVVEIINSFGCTQSDSVKISTPLIQTAGGNDVTPLHIYPNPTQGHLCVVLQKQVPSSIDLHDIMGCKIQTIKTVGYTPNSTVSFELHQLSAGVYLLTSWYDSKEWTVQRVIVE